MSYCDMQKVRKNQIIRDFKGYNWFIYIRFVKNNKKVYLKPRRPDNVDYIIFRSSYIFCNRLETLK